MKVSLNDLYKALLIAEENQHDDNASIGKQGQEDARKLRARIARRERGATQT